MTGGPQGSDLLPRALRPTRARARDQRHPDDIAVLVVDRQLYEDGGARVVLRLVDLWRRARVRVQIYLLQRPADGTGAQVPPGVHPLYPTAQRELRLRWALLWGFLRMLPLARGADVVLAGRELGYGLVLGRVAAAIVRRPFAVMIQSDPLAAMHHYESARMQPLVRWALTTADRLVCVSPGLVPTVEALGVERDRISVAQNGVDVDAVVAAAQAPAPPLPDGAGPLVVGIGRMVHQKGFDVLVRAHAHVVAAGLPHRLLLLGEGRDRGHLERLVDELGVSGSVHLPGFVDNPLPVLAAADLYCLPSRWEGSPLTLAEAMIAGAPIVAADCVSGPRHLLAEGRYGDLVPVEDAEALAAAIERHLREPERLRAAAAEGRTWARENLDVHRSVAEVLDALRDVVASRRRDAA